MSLKLLFTMVAVISWTGTACAQDVHVRVSPDPTGGVSSADNFPTIQMALDHAAQPGAGGRLYVHISPGAYHERVMVTQNHPRVTLLGMGKDAGDVVITASENAKSAGGTFFSSTVFVSGEGFEADNLTFQNAAGNTGQAVAISVRSDRAIFKHCRFLGDQDTLFADWGRQYYVDSYIEGGVDFIFGNAAAVFADVEVHIIRAGYLTAQSRTSLNQPTGYVFLHARVTNADLGGKQFYLGRPWRPFSRVLFLESELPEGLSPQGWSPWKPAVSLGTAFYGERGNTGPGAGMSGRAKGSHALTEEEAAAFMPDRFLAGDDHWNPIAEAAKLP